MATYFMFGIYSLDALEGISSGRTSEADKLITKYGGKVNSMYALMGEQDLVLIVEFPSVQQAMQASAALSKLTGISFSTSPAISVAQFDQLITEV